MVKKKFKYIASVVLMVLIAFTFIFSTLLRVINRDISKAAATVQVHSVDELKNAINGTDEEIEIMGNIDIPCGSLTPSSAGNWQTAEIVINRSVTIKSGGDSSTKTLKRTYAEEDENNKNNLRSLFEIIGEGVEVKFEKITLDGGAVLPEELSDRISFSGNDTIGGRALIDVCQNATVSVGEDCTIQNSFNNSKISTHGYEMNLTPCGGAIRTDFYSNGSDVDLRGGTVNLLNDSVIKDCSTKAVNGSSELYVDTLESYGGAVAAYDLGNINMYEGSTIQNCTSANGGAIGLCHGPSAPYTTGTLNLNGGTIESCRAIKGGAINVGENSDETPRLNLTGTGSTYFSNCESQEGGGVLYIDTGNKIQLAENQSNTGKVQIATSCTGGSSKGSDGNDVPTKYLGYKNQIEFENATANSSYFDECVVVDTQTSQLEISGESLTPTIKGGVAYYEVSTSAQLKQAFADSTNGKINIKLIADNILQEDVYSIGKSGLSQVVILDLNEKTLKGHLTDGEAWRILDDSTLIIKNGTVTRVDLTTDSSGCLVFSNVEVPAGATTAQIQGQEVTLGNGVYIGTANCWVLNNSTIANFKAELGKANGGNSNTLSYLTSFENTEEKKAQLRASGVSGDSSTSSYQTGGNLATVLVGKGDTARCFATLQEAFNLVDSDPTTYNYIQLLSDYDMPENEVLLTEGVTLDLWGNTLKTVDDSQNNIYRMLHLKNTSGTVSVINGTIDGSLDMVQQGDITDSTYTSGNVELENLTINGNIYNDGHPTTIKSGSYAGFFANGASTSNISGGTFTGDIKLYGTSQMRVYGGDLQNIALCNQSQMQISGGNISGNIILNSPPAENNSSDVGSQISVTGGNLSNLYVCNENSVANISGGYFSGTVSKVDENFTEVEYGTIKITGGKFLNSPNSSYIETGYASKSVEESINNITYNYEVINHPSHENWTYSTENNNTLKATCGTCDFTASLTLNAPADKTYDGSSIDAANFDETEQTNWTAAGLNLPEITYEGTGTTSYSTSTTPPTGAGVYLVKISAIGSDNVTKTVEVSFNINKASPTLALFNISGLTGQTYDGTGKSVTVTEKNNKTEFTDKLTVEYYYTKNDTENWYTDAPANAGEYPARLVITGADNYSDAAIELGDNNKLKIEKVTGQLPTVDAISATYGQTLSELTLPTSDYGTFAWVNGETELTSVSNGQTFRATFTPNDTDNYDWSGIDADGKISVSVTVNVAKATLTKEMFTLNSTEDTYDGNAKELDLSIPEGLISYVLEYSSDNGTTWSTNLPKDAGTYKIKVKSENDANYNNAEIVLDSNFTVNKATGQLPNVDAISAIYGQTLNEITLPTSDYGTFAWVNGETKLTSVSNGQTFSATFTPNDTDNYDWSGSGIDADGKISVSVTVNVAKATLTKEMFTLNSAEGIFDGNEKTLDISIPEGLTSYTLEYSSDDGTTWSANLPKDAGTYKIKVKSANDTNYNDAEIVLDSNFKVNKATGQLPNVDAISATYGQTLNELTLPTSDYGTFAWVNGETKLTSVSNGQTFSATFTPNDTDNYDWSEAGTSYADGKVTFDVIVNVGKASPESEHFAFAPPDDLGYSGNVKSATVTPASGVVGTGDITVRYYSNEARTNEINAQEVKNAGTYYVGITVAEGDNYTTQSTVIYDNSWNFEISKATPTANDFTFAPPNDSGYDGNVKEATVTPASGVVGMGDITVRYYSNEARTNEINADEVKNAGTYYVGVATLEGDNYLAPSEVLTDENWKFTIDKAIPAPEHFTFTPPTNLVYNGSAQTSLGTVSAVDGVNGIGTATLHYYSDASRASDKEISASNIVNAGAYYVGITVEEGGNYTAQSTVIYDNSWNFEISKATPTANDFTFAPPTNLVYNGSAQTSLGTVSAVDGVNGIGTATLHYYSDASRASDKEISASNIVNAGAYYVGITVEEGDNYTAQSTVIYDNSWNFEISKATPTVNDFTFAPPNDSGYDGNVKEATVTPAIGIVGMGDITVRYYGDEARSNEIDADEVKNAGTYYVGVTTLEGDNYLAPSEVLTDGNWKFTIDKAIPAPEHFAFTPPNDSGYDGGVKEATVTPASGVVGMGDITVRYYRDEARTNEINAQEVKNAGTYYVGVATLEGYNYLAPSEVLTDENWKFTIDKAIPAPEHFTFTPPNDSGYDGGVKEATVTPASGVVGTGDITVRYYSNEARTNEINAQEVKNAGTYYVGITVAEGDNYTAQSTVIYDNSWNFEISKVTPTANDFTFAPPTNLVYNGSAQTSLGTVSAVDGVNGIGTATLHYYSDASRASDKEISASNIVNAGAYYVGITVEEGTNYLATGENVVLLKENWNFTVSKAEPILDFNIISGGPTGQDPQLQTENIPEFSYGKTLEDYKDALPKLESGTWAFKDTAKGLKPAGTQYIELVFTPNDTNNFDWSKVPGYDPETKTITVKLLVDVVVEKETWGDPVDNNGVVNYESNDGSTSVEIAGDNIYWVKETSYDTDLGHDTSAWYAIDNGQGIFEKGSRFLIRWINKEENPEEWNRYLPMIDSDEAQNIPDKKRWIFIAEVIHPDGTTRYERLDQPVPLYVQKGEDWDTDDVEAYFISQGADERLNKEYINSMAYPGGNGEFFKLDLLHFSPYTIYDADPVSSSRDNNKSEKDGTNKEDSQNKSNQENTKNGVNPWYIVAGVGLLGMSLLIGFLIYKKRKKEKDAVMYSVLAQIGKSSTMG